MLPVANTSSTLPCLPLSHSPSPPPLLLRALLPFAPTVRVLRIRLKHSSAARVGLVDLLRLQS